MMKKVLLIAILLFISLLSANTQVSSVYKVFGYRPDGKLASQKPAVINLWLGMDPHPVTIPLKNTGRGYIYTTSSRDLSARSADVAFVLDNEWDNNGSYRANYHPARNCEQATVQSSSAATDEISRESWRHILQKLQGDSGREPARYSGGYCADNTGGHNPTDCGSRYGASSCNANPNCRWVSNGNGNNPPISTDH